MEIPQIKLEISANAVAWYGAIVATIAAAVSIFMALRDRARIKIICEKDRIIIGEQSIYPKDKTYFNVSVVNRGRRPIRIEKVAFRTIGRKKRFALFSDSFLQERRKVLTEEYPRTDFMTEQDEDLLKSVWYIAIYDGAGKTYKKYLKFFPIVLFIKSWLKKLRK